MHEDVPSNIKQKPLVPNTKAVIVVSAARKSDGPCAVMAHDCFTEARLASVDGEVSGPAFADRALGNDFSFWREYAGEGGSVSSICTCKAVLGML